MKKEKLTRNRKKIFPRTIVVKISEKAYENVMKTTEKSKMTKSEAFREIIDVGVEYLKNK